MKDAYVLVHDIGTTGDKACLFDEEGNILGKEYGRYDTYYPHSGWVEQSPQEWWQTACENTRSLIEANKIDPSKIACIAWSGQMMGCVPVDDKGKLIGNRTMIWADSRASEEAENIMDELGGWKEFYSITGTGQNVDRYPVAKILWLKNNRPKTYRKANNFLNAKDYFSLRLTGNQITDFTDGFHSGIMDIKEEDWSDEIIEAADLERDKLPELRESVEVIGHTREAPAEEMGIEEDIPVVAGAGDVSAAAAGAGVVEEGDSYISVGSACWTGSFSDDIILDEETRISCHRHVVPGKFAPHNYTYSGGISKDWVKDTMFPLEDKVLEESETTVHELMDHEAEKVEPGSEGVLFLPYLRGGGAPHYNENIKGTFLGLTMSHGRAHLARSVYEGVAFNTRIIQENFEGLGTRIKDNWIIGGGAMSKLWRQIFTDVTGKDILRSDFVHEANSLGAAVVGGVGIGLFDDFSIVKEIIEKKDLHEPQPEVREKYDRIYSVFKDAYKEVEPVYDRMASIE